MTIAQLSAALIMSFEGCRLTAYWDPNGKIWTIGFGHTDGVTEGMQITMEQAILFLSQDYAPLIDLVKDRPTLEAACLVSFGHNCGKGALERVLAGSIHIQDEEFTGIGGLAYGESAGEHILAGLVARRRLEAILIELSRDSA